LYGFCFFPPPLKLVRKEKLKHRISQKTHTKPRFTLEIPLLKGETLNFFPPPAGMASLRSVASQTGARGYLS
jgi:hypothetical protein